MVQPVFASSYLETLQLRAHQKNLANHPYWHRLLHERRNLLGVYQSEIDDPSFFLAPRGRKDPSAELDATLAAFAKTSSPAVTGGGSMDPRQNHSRMTFSHEDGISCALPADGID